ncbi:MAG: hypothetical protein ACE3JP_04070 [Ectobacillus sp.]
MRVFAFYHLAIYKLITKVPAVIRTFRASKAGIPAFFYRFEQALSSHMKPSRMMNIYCTELAVFYYALASWRKRPFASGEALAFTYHQKTGAIALYVMLIHALVIESIGLHVLLHSWSPVVSIVMLILNIYTILLFLAEIQAIRLSPFFITNETLYLQIGVMKRLAVSFQDVKSIRYRTSSRENPTGLPLG